MRRALLGRAGLGLAAAGALVWSGCGPPARYARYRSPFSDFTCAVPSGWPAIIDAEGRDYYQITFTGPFDPNFYKGIPSLSVRWYRTGKPHRLPNGENESYASAQDFMDQLRRDVYGPDGLFKGGDEGDVRTASARGELLGDSTRIRMAGPGGEREGLFFVAYNRVPAPAFATYGVVADEHGNRVLDERHGYLVLPVRGGFYVLVYPATRVGFARHKPAFLQLIKSFHLLSEGPR